MTETEKREKAEAVVAQLKFVIDALKAENARLREALEYYAGGGKPTKEYPLPEFGCGCCIWERTDDEIEDYRAPTHKGCGELARKALGR